MALTSQQVLTPATDNTRLARRVKRLSTSVAKVAYGANQTEATTAQLLAAISAIGRQMESQQQTIGQAVQIISELGAFSQEIAASVGEVAVGAEQSAAAVGKGKEAVLRSTDVMTRIQATVAHNSEAVRSLGIKTQEINKIVVTIKEIASQTNLLALNAAIEAARAGEQGRGFAVVADEVKKLAGDSAEAASQISKLIAAIQNEAASTVSALAESVESVREGSRVVLETGHALDEIISAVANSNRQVQDISDAVTQQAQNSDKLMQVTDSMKQAVDQAAVFVETASFDAEQQQASMNTLLSEASDLQQLEQRLESGITLAVDDHEKPYVFGLPSDPVTLDPALSQDTNSNNIIREVFIGLLQLGMDSRPIPAIASTWHLEEDGRTYTFALRQDVFFHHGRQVVAQDAKYTFERLVNPATKSPRAGLFMGIEGAREYAEGRAREISGIRVLDRFKLSIRLITPNLTFLGNLANANASLVPQDVIEQHGAAEFAKHPVGAGPFVVQQWLPGDRIELTSNPKYFEGRPYVGHVVVRIYQGADALQDAFFQGEVNHLRIDGGGFDHLQKDPVLRSLAAKLDPVDVQYCGILCDRPPFDNKLVRQALNYAFDRETYLRDVLKGHAVVSRGPLPPAWVNETVQPYRYDLNKAKELMRQAGYANGYPGEVIIHVRDNNVEQAARAAAVAAALDRIGIRARIVAVPWIRFTSQETMSQCNLYLIAATGGHAEGGSYIDTWLHSSSIGKSNFARFSHPEVDRLIDEAKTVINPQKRHELYLKANAVVHEEAPWLFLYHPLYYMARQPRVKGLRFRNNGDVMLKSAWVEEEGE